MRPTTSASNMFRRELCPGSHAAESAFPEEDDGEYAAEGTNLHDLLANPTKDRSGLTLAQREVVEIAEGGAEDIIKAVVVHASLENAEKQEGNEKELWLRKGIKNLYPGHCDKWSYWPEKKILSIIDHKFGFRPVDPASSNIQLRSYAVMAASVWDCDHIIVAINQPRLHREERVTMAEYSRESIPSAKEHLLSIWDNCHKEDAPRIADSEKQCLYCKAKVTCDAYRAKYSWMSQIPKNQVESFTGQLAQLTDEQFGQVFDACTFAGRVFDAVKAEGRKRCAAGGLKEFALGKPRKDAKITDRWGAWSILNKSLSTQDLVECSKIGLGDVSERIAKVFSLSLAEAKRRVKDDLSPVLEISETEPPISRSKHALEDAK
jgi:hypothetical protein